MRILFTTVSLVGHFFPLVPLAWACRSHGHDVLVTTSDNFVPTVLRSGLPVTPCGPAAGVADLAAADAVSLGPEEQRYAHGRAFARIAARNMAGTASVVESWRPDVIVSERAEFAGPVIAAAHRIPHAELHWGLAALREYRSAAAELVGQLTELGLDEYPRPAGVLNPWPPSLRAVRTAEHTDMRFVPYNGDAHVPGWVLEPRRRPRICLTLGTVRPHLGTWAPQVVIPLLENLGRRGVELVVAMDDAVVAGWPRLPGAVRHAGRIPLSHLLGTCDAVINHGGQGSVLTALERGCPQLVLPQIDDQFDNADAVARAGAGLRLSPEQATAQSIAGSCMELLHADRFGPAAGRIAAEIAGGPPVSRTVEMLERLAARRDSFTGASPGDRVG